MLSHNKCSRFQSDMVQCCGCNVWWLINNDLVSSTHPALWTNSRACAQVTLAQIESTARLDCCSNNAICPRRRCVGVPCSFGPRVVATCEGHWPHPLFARASFLDHTNWPEHFGLGSTLPLHSTTCPLNNSIIHQTNKQSQSEV